MKTPEQYLIDTLKKYGQFENKVYPLQMDVEFRHAIEAIGACMLDHEKFIDEQLEKVDKLGERIKVLNDTISAINGELKRHLGD